MKAANITNILNKSKLSGYDVGRMMMQGLLYELKQIYEEHREETEPLFSKQEIIYFQDQLTDSYDIQIYNSCRRLFEYITRMSDLATIFTKELQLIAIQIVSIIINENSESIKFKLSSYKKDTKIINDLEQSILDTIQIGYSKTEAGRMVLDKVQEFIEVIKQWFVLEAAVKVVSERMELPDLMLLVRETPINKLVLVNALIKDLQFLYPENQVSKTLFENGIGHYTPDDKVPENIDVININELKPAIENIERARATIQDLRYFKDGNFDFHKIIEGKLD
ncbi:MAG: hypothetical protein ACM3TR_20095 [Caulobacteraceae bacterium]